VCAPIVLSLFAGILLAPPVLADDKAEKKADDKSAKKADDKEAQDALFRGLGGVSAAYLYEAHQKVGILAEARAKKVFDLEQCEQELQVTINILKVVDKQMAALLAQNIPEAEKKSVTSVRAIVGNQIKAAEALKAHWNSGDAEDLAEFESRRALGWSELRKLMRLNKNPGGIRNDGKAKD
jgi:hypothetical protein